jgi:hypothetical protein
MHDNLLRYRWDKYTTRGNDGIIRRILEILKRKSGVFVEFGAWDGIVGSNCRRLVENDWGGLFIESDKERYKQLVKNYSNNQKIICYRAMVGFDGDNLFDNIIKRTLDSNIDFCSIDIDGLDLEVFETFNVLPDVVCIEGGQMLHPFHDRIDVSVAKHNIQQSLSVMNESFEKKGYKILCTYQDSFFVKESFYELFNVSSDLMELYFDGLEASRHRLPWIDSKLKNVGLNNKIISKILKLTSYNKYGWKNRKLWAKDKNGQILEAIQEIKYNQKRSRV